MYCFVVVLSLVGCALGGILPQEFGGRIVNGEPTTIVEHPYQVSLQRRSGFHFCGGSIINEDTIVTAAHCMELPYSSQIMVRLGSTGYRSGGELVAIRSFKIHEGFNNVTWENDVCVIKLASPVRLSSKIWPIALAKKTPPTGTKAVVTGWGVKCSFFCSKSPENMLKAEVEIIKQKDCASKKYKYGSKIKENMVCAGGNKKDACRGDSGGPLVSGGQLVGVVSWGNSCARKAYPGVYADVSVLREWILRAAATL